MNLWIHTTVIFWNINILELISFLKPQKAKSNLRVRKPTNSFFPKSRRVNVSAMFFRIILLQRFNTIVASAIIRIMRLRKNRWGGGISPTACICVHTHVQIWGSWIKGRRYGTEPCGARYFVQIIGPAFFLILFLGCSFKRFEPSYSVVYCRKESPFYGREGF